MSTYVICDTNPAMNSGLVSMVASTDSFMDGSALAKIDPNNPTELIIDSSV